MQVKEQRESEFENPLIWPILSILEEQPSGWKVHTLAEALGKQDMITSLDDDSYLDLFKRNFLMMNALFQLQEMLLPKQWLQAEAMDICLMWATGGGHQINYQDPLREYYLDWQNYDASHQDIKVLMDSFWKRYQQHVNENRGHVVDLDRDEALVVFGLPMDASDMEIRRTWRKLALKWHPDRQEGNAEKFREVCEAWQILRAC
ncbi:DNA-J related domain-containing protein [Thaumasiovibrio subtropicus]|uniref:DNA-J related domain-containing protein n=1 Tax=Thaumasiovibrio subtropicus TaxID=1891207 RepID=UPI000B35F04A|nr:DNA-J related domain-containing protein [Thaumasiovibrio subtropicus]